MSINPAYGTYAILDPSFGADWRHVPAESPYVDGESKGLADDATVISVEHAGLARAYPLTILGIHEVINDTLVGAAHRAEPGGADAVHVVVTYCPLCRSGLVADRVIGGELTRFHVSGLLWEPPVIAASHRSDSVFGADVYGGEERTVDYTGNLVMYDEATGSYWSQVLARAVCGPQRGAALGIMTSSLSTWGDWRAAHPEGKVLLPPPFSKTAGPNSTETARPHETG